jgi:hypothetical protein
MIGGVRGKPIKLSETPVTQVLDCFLCYRTASGTGAESGTKRLLNSFYPQATRLLNSSSNGHRTIYINLNNGVPIKVQYHEYKSHLDTVSPEHTGNYTY